MEHIILKKLSEIEKAENVRILYCVESGSRAWGFASPDSDYDVRFVYVRPMDFYLRLDETRDVIEWQLNDTLDINGWDIQKAFRLLHNSNPTLFEWNSSPIVYKKTKEWDKVDKIIDRYFINKAGIYHYLSMAKRNYSGYLKEETVRLKKYFYVLRPIFACKWILDKQTPPPVLFSELSDIYMDGNIKSEVERLLEIKLNTPETASGKRIDVLNDYIRRNIEEIEKAASKLPQKSAGEWSMLNELFLGFFK